MKIIALIIIVALTALGTSPSLGEETPGKTLYTCGMHPQIIQDHPGNCPICGMKLTPIRSGAGAESHASPGGAAAISIDAATRQSMNLRTATVASGPLNKVIRTVGTIAYNETALADVNTKFKGWIEKLDVDASGQLVHRGDAMFEIYSPDLYSAESEYALALNGGLTNDPGASELRETAASKLRFFDVSEAQIEELKKSGVPRKALSVSAPISGFVIEKNVVQGQMVDAGMRLYRIADLAIVWVLAEIYEQDLPFVQLGQEAVVRVASLPDREFRGRVTYVYPTVDEKTRTARVRLEFENPGYFLRPGMFVSAEIQAEIAGSAVLVPDSAVLRSGAKNTVFVALNEGRFEPRDVSLGVEASDGMIQVLSGLQVGDRVVTSGQFLLDSESQLREAIDKMRGSAPAEPAESALPLPTNAAPPSATPPEPETAVYVCPMPEHVSIVYDHPGTCPICGMDLVPIMPSALKKIQPGGKVLYYVCPMPEHANLHRDKPGKCPLCGMTLVPIMSKPEVAPAAEVQSAKKYTCPMHPEVISDHPGQCPKCGMDLVPVSK